MPDLGNISHDYLQGPWEQVRWMLIEELQQLRAALNAQLQPFAGDSGAGGGVGLVPAPARGAAAAGEFLSASGVFLTPSAGSSTGSGAQFALDGVDGTDGPPGPPGLSGTTGATGATGATGSSGPPGLNGMDGEDGVGIPGSAGGMGASGSMGPAGFDGDEGPEGFAIPGRSGSGDDVLALAFAVAL